MNSKIKKKKKKKKKIKITLHNKAMSTNYIDIITDEQRTY